MQELVTKEISQPPPNTCTICCGVNGVPSPLQLYANGLHTLWVCYQCQDCQASVLQANFYLPQTNIPAQEAVPYFTFDLPVELPLTKRSRLDGSLSPPPKRRSRIPHTPQPWETIINNSLSHQERILSVWEQLQALHTEQQRNMKNLKAAVPSMQDYEDVKQENELLTAESAVMSKKVKLLEEQQLSAQLAILELRNALSELPSTPESENLSQLAQKLFDILNTVKSETPVDPEVLDTAPPAPVGVGDFEPMTTS